jgi:hypothetical protein
MLVLDGANGIGARTERRCPDLRIVARRLG